GALQGAALGLLIVLAAAAALALAGVSLAQDRDAAPAPRRTVYQVIVPVDEDGRPWGDYLYVPRPFYDLLRRRAAESASPSQRWLIHNAQYQAGLHWSADAGQLELGDLTATYDIEVLQSDASVRLPFQRAKVHLPDEFAQWNGRPMPVRWEDEKGEALLLRAPSAGRFRVS